MTNFEIFGWCALFLVSCLAVAWAARHLHKPDTAEKLQADQAREAAILSLQWRAQAEHAAALAEMYAARVERLKNAI